MPATVSTDWNFAPKVWQDHITAFFRRKLAFGALATTDDTLKASPGETVNFPFYEKIGDAEEPLETGSLTVDNLSDDSFPITVKEVGKAVGAKDKALYVSADRREGIFEQVQTQMGRVMAEKVDKDLLTEMETVAADFTAAAAADVLTIQRLNSLRISVFGDLHEEAVAVYMHSQAFLSMMNDSTAGFLKADANDPLWKVPGFAGRVLGMGIILTDSATSETAIGGKAAYSTYICKANPYGIAWKQDMNPEQDRDILAREWVWSATMWYGVKHFDQKVSADDRKIARGIYPIL